MKSTSEKIKKSFFIRNLGNEAYQLSKLRHAPEMSSVIYDIRKGFAKGILPLKPENTSHFYYLKDEDDKPIAVFKTHNYLKEYAAYRLDHNRFANVPPTVVTTLEHFTWEGKKTGSLQLFIDNAATAVDLKKSAYKRFSAECVRRIAALDIRCINGDRHTSNLLVRDSSELIPIDHEFILQNKIYIAGISWLFWEQSYTEFNEEELAYILALDPAEDRKMLMEEMEIEEEIATRFYVATILLKNGAQRKVSPHTLGSFLKRRHYKDENPSVLEQLLDKLKKFNSFSWTIFAHHVYEEVEKVLDEHAFS